LSQSNADLFRSLHRDGLLILPNAWDACSARLVEEAGARALATSSAAVAWAHGYADGNHLPVPLLVATAAAIARGARVPLSVDMEGGYSDDPAAVGKAIEAVLGAGAVGINLEDGAGAPELLCAKIIQARQAGQRAGVDVFVNARTDVYIKPLVPPERRVDEVVRRAALYRSAGADGIFAPGLTDRAEITAVVSGAPLPLNVMARAGLPAAAELRDLGVRRLSAGVTLACTVHARLRELAAGFLKDGESAPLLAGIPYPELNGLLGRRP
jgi:2-methylisocitrate lyase-like PEP mutase family enzyme